MTDPAPLTLEDGAALLRLARLALAEAVCGQPLKPPDLDALPEALRRPGATFVTLTRLGELRGCVGALEAYLPLAEDVRVHAAAAALQDYRFLPVRPEELAEIEIEVSCLTEAQPLAYHRPEELLARLRPGVDGVILRDGHRRATFLPQVWEKLPEPELFLSQLCQKMGADPCLWQRKPLQALTYQVVEFHEAPAGHPSARE